MPGRATADPVNYHRLAEGLDALGYPVRLELVNLLRFPHLLHEIRVSPQRGVGGDQRSAARQTVQRHLDKLVEVGLLRTEPVEEGGKSLRRYAANPQRLYALTEELRRTFSFEGAEPAGEATGTLPARAPPRPRKGPRLVLVHGMYEGKSFPLEGGERWVIGRRKGAAVCLDYDPFVSLENAAVLRGRGAYAVEDVPGSKNGTHVNWERLPPGGTCVLERGDIVGVGRSLLSFRPE
ncbi:MAG TPA: FHA domain-containing protein [Candidatus Thermoplasmatota archaeon]|jgi:hypothetical protein|nr:FHA domain-containing protein [Candidatus Thermoplasmatota archaeon]